MLKSRWRIVTLVAVIAGFGLVVAVHPQDVSEIGTMAHDLRATLKDVDDRLRHLEQLVKELSKAAGKASHDNPPAVVTKSTSKRFASQEAYQKGRIEEDSQQYAKAIELFTKACELDPSNDSAFLHRGIVSYRIGRVDQALADVNRSLAIQPDNSRAIAFRASVYRTMKDYAHALADLAEAVRRDSGNPEYLVSEGDIEQERGNSGKAAEVYAAALAIAPQSAEIHLKRAAALKATDDRQGALEECARAIALKPKDAGGYTCRADYYVRLGQFPAAVSDLNQAIAIKPDFAQAVSLLPVVRELLEVNRAAGRLNPPPPEPIAIAPPPPPPPPVAPPPPAVVAEAAPPIAVVPTPEPQAPASAPALVAAPVEPPPAPAPPPGKVSELMQTARKYLDQGQFTLAIFRLNDALTLDPSSAPAYNARGYAFLRSRAYASAVSDFTRAIELSPTYANAYWNRSAAKRLQGDKQGASEDAQKAARLGWVVDTSNLKASR